MEEVEGCCSMNRRGDSVFVRRGCGTSASSPSPEPVHSHIYTKTEWVIGVGLRICLRVRLDWFDNFYKVTVIS